MGSVDDEPATAAEQAGQNPQARAASAVAEQEHRGGEAEATAAAATQEDRVGVAKPNPAKRIRSALDAMLDEAAAGCTKPKMVSKPIIASELVSDWCLYRDIYGKNGMASGGAHSDRAAKEAAMPEAAAAVTPVVSEPADESLSLAMKNSPEIAMFAP